MPFSVATPACRREVTAHAPREVRAVPFGPWTVSEIYNEGNIIGYGANCNWHRNVWDKPTDRCKKALTFGYRMTHDHCRIRMKLWLLKGVHIHRGVVGGRHQHVDRCGNPAQYDVTEMGTEVELDALAAGYAA